MHSVFRHVNIAANFWVSEDSREYSFDGAAAQLLRRIGVCDSDFGSVKFPGVARTTTSSSPNFVRRYPLPFGPIPIIKTAGSRFNIFGRFPDGKVMVPFIAYLEQLRDQVLERWIWGRQRRYYALRIFLQRRVTKRCVQIQFGFEDKLHSNSSKFPAKRL